MNMKNKLKLLLVITFALTVLGINAQQWGHFTLYAPQNGTATYLIDTNNTSTILKTWTHTTATKTGYSAYLLPGGTLVRTISRSGNSFTGGPICGEVQKVDWNGNVIWDYVYSTTSYCSHHDICPMPNGNVLIIAYERKTASEVVAAGCSTFSNEMWPDKIVEVQPTGATTGTVVWEWHAWDHLVQSTNASAANYQTSVLAHPELLNINQNATKDWLHLNGVDYNPILDQITFTSHALSEIYVIDHSTTSAQAASHSGGNSGKGGDILFRWGKPTNYGATGTTFINVCHDATWITEGLPYAGGLSYYNNGGASGASCGDFIMPPTNGYVYNYTANTAYAPSTYSKRQLSGGTNTNMGNIQMLPNGNTLINMGISGYIKEFSPTGTLLWSKTLGGSNAKAFRYDSCYVMNAAPAIPTVTQNGNDLEATSATTYQWYLNGVLISGANSQTYTPTLSGIYVVRITDTNGCVYRYSPGFSFTATATGVASSSSDIAFDVYPNPSEGNIKFNPASLAGYNYIVMVYDLYGKLIRTEKNVTELDLTELNSGIYLLNVVSTKGTITKRITIQK
jgi:Arylsulfotransferase (ASST)/Secretion system C-terminal sorting domain